MQDSKKCISTNGTGTGPIRGAEYLSNIDFISSSEDNSRQYVLMESKTATYDFDGISVDCRFAIDSYSSSKIVENEIVIVPVTIGLFNNPAGLAEDAVINKIENAVDKTEGIWETLDQINDWIEIIELLCRIYHAIISVIEFLQALNATLGILELSLDSIPIIGNAAAGGVAAAEGAICEAETGANIFAKGAYAEYENGFKMFCSWVNCDISLWELLAQDGKVGDVTGGMRDFLDRANSPSSLVAGSENDNLKKAFGELDKAGITIFDEDNIIYMMAAMCVPGLIKKAHQWRAIQCNYATCLIEQAETGIVDERICSDVKSSQECEFLLKIFNFVPFSGLFELIYDWLASFWASNWLAKVNMAVTLGCQALCGTTKYVGTTKSVCEFYVTVQNLVDAAAELEAIGDTDGYFSSSLAADAACDDMDSAFSRFKKNQKTLSEELAERSGTQTQGNTVYGGTQSNPSSETQQTQSNINVGGQQATQTQTTETPSSANPFAENYGGAAGGESQ